MGFGDGNLDCGHCQDGFFLFMEIQHLTDIHLIDVITAEDTDVVRRAELDETKILIDGIGRTVIPALPHPHLGRDWIDESAGDTGQIPPFFHMQVERLGLELGQNVDTQEVRVNEIVQDKVDQTITATKWYRRFATSYRQWLQACAFAPCQYHRQYTSHTSAPRMKSVSFYR